ncbi:tRNA-histidine guanylyltransferase 1-like [Dipsacomyces acuminosporus]|nr:tRNA-histidine guanylyltransferase 1-like [Dipsacomyces acuminosporus]
MSGSRRLNQGSEKGAALASLHIPTPLLYSTGMSKQAGCNVWLKLENLQPTQSFKIRGIGRFCSKAVLEQGAARLVTAGDSNAALAVAYSGRQLGVPVTIFVPAGTQASVARAKIEVEGAEIVESGRSVKETCEAARLFVSKTEGAVIVDTADDPAVIAGNATIAAEINIQLQRKDPAVIITVVGSGGHLAGLLSGLQRCQWQSVPVIAVETHNTNSFQQALLSDTQISESMRASRGVNKKRKPRSLARDDICTPSLLPPMDADVSSSSDTKTGISSGGHQSRVRSASDRPLEPTVATCLLSGSTCPSALELSRTHPVVPVSVSEAMAAEACRRLLDEHQLLVEVGMTGGANINFDRLESYRQRFPYPAPIIAKSGHEIFMRMSDPTSSTAGPMPSGDLNAAANHPKPSGMAKSKYEYVRSFEQDDHLLPSTWLVVRIDGQGFTKFTAKHGFTKPNDIRALNLMNRAAKQVMESMAEIVLAYGQSDEYSFVFSKDAKAYDRRASKIISLLVSKFTSAHVFNWNEFFPDTPLQFPPAFDSRIVMYPSADILRHYLCWRQVDCHINNMYNTCFWALVNQGGLSQKEAEKRLCGTLSSDKNELLFSEFGINYNNEKDIFKKGSVLIRDKELTRTSEEGGRQTVRTKIVVQILHCDIIKDAFWNSHPEILRDRPTRAELRNEREQQRKIELEAAQQEKEN